MANLFSEIILLMAGSAVLVGPFMFTLSVIDNGLAGTFGSTRGHNCKMARIGRSL